MSMRKSDLLTQRIRRYSSAERMTLLRNLGYGGAAACLAILAGLAQVGAKDPALKVAVYAASIALPAWLLIGSVFEYYIFLGKQSYRHLRSKFVIALTSTLYVVAGVGMFAATGGIAWYLAPEAAYAFAFSAFCAVVLGLAFHAHLAGWWDREVVSKGKDDVDG